MFLVDTNVWLGRLLGQERAQEAGEFFDRILTSQLFVTDFALFSIAITLFRADKADAFQQFVQDVLLMARCR